MTFWIAPVMTLGHLLFSVATLAGFLVGIYFPEADLVVTYGGPYHFVDRRH